MKRSIDVNGAAVPRIPAGQRLERRRELAPYPLIDSVQWLRFVAASLVVLYHVEVQLMRLSPGHENQFRIGAAGVDLFFVISGFIMVVVTESKPTGAADFLTARLKRIVPLYWLFTLTLLVLATSAPWLLNSSRFDLAHTIASLLFVPYPHPVLDAVRPLLVPGWTLNYEMFFYIAFALLLYVPLGLRIAIIGGCFGGLVVLRMWVGTDGLLLGFYGHPIVLEFVGGTIAGAFWLRLRAPGKELLAGLLLAAAVMILAGVDAGVGEEENRVLFWGPAAFALLLACVLIEKRYGWPNVPLLRHLGDASYATYLSHLFVLAVVEKINSVSHGYALLGDNGMRVLMLASALMVGSVVHVFVERPLGAMLTANIGRRGNKQGRVARAA